MVAYYLQKLDINKSNCSNKAATTARLGSDLTWGGCASDRNGIDDHYGAAITCYHLRPNTIYTAAASKEFAETFQPQGVTMAFGGLVFNGRPNLLKLIPGHFLDDSIYIVVQRIARRNDLNPNRVSIWKK